MKLYRSLPFVFALPFRVRVVLAACLAFALSSAFAEPGYAGSTSETRPQLRLPSIFGDHMVLQRDRDVRIFGTAGPGDKITTTVTWGPPPRSSKADANGAFELKVPAAAMGSPAAKMPHEIRIESGRGASITLRDVLFGEVWVCSGQSNMEWPMHRSDGGEEAIQATRDPRLRLFRVAHATSFEPKHDVQGSWQPATPESARSFSAVAIAFGRELRRTTDAPIGLVQSTWGGTPVRAWMPPRSLADQPMLAAWEERRVRARSRRAEDPAADVGAAQRIGSTLYLGMIHPLVRKPIRGAIWYQGEADTPHPELYLPAFSAMVHGWREAWGQGDFPFYWVQIAPFRYSADRNAAGLRDAQRLAEDVVPRGGMVVTLDIGDPADIHPSDKRTVGQRLARLARARAYGDTQVVASGPTYRDHDVRRERVGARELGVVHLRFDRASGGLTTTGKRPPGPFLVAGKDRRFVPANARIVGESIRV